MTAISLHCGESLGALMRSYLGRRQHTSNLEGNPTPMRVEHYRVFVCSIVWYKYDL